jgi:hypothetical protein
MFFINDSIVMGNNKSITRQRIEDQSLRQIFDQYAQAWIRVSPHNHSKNSLYVDLSLLTNVSCQDYEYTPIRALLATELCDLILTGTFIPQFPLAHESARYHYATINNYFVSLRRGFPFNPDRQYVVISRHESMDEAQFSDRVLLFINGTCVPFMWFGGMLLVDNALCNLQLADENRVSFIDFGHNLFEVEKTSGDFCYLSQDGQSVVVNLKYPVSTHTPILSLAGKLYAPGLGDVMLTDNDNVITLDNRFSQMSEAKTSMLFDHHLRYIYYYPGVIEFVLQDIRALQLNGRYFFKQLVDDPFLSSNRVLVDTPMISRRNKDHGQLYESTIRYPTKTTQCQIKIY